MNERPGRLPPMPLLFLSAVMGLAPGCAVSHFERDFAPGAGMDCARWADTLDEHLRRDVLGRWLPRCVDRAGGFHQRMGRDWRLLPDDSRFLVFQARMTWVAATAALHDPARAEYKAAALHGLTYLAETMWDAEHGGLHWRLGSDGRVSKRFGTEKHAYAISFAIYAAAAVYEATRDPRALDLGTRTFDWLDKHAHDDAHGGYFEPLARDGTPVLAPHGTPGRAGHRPTDGIGTPYGYKSMNTHIHLLEAFSALYRVRPDKHLRARLEEMLTIVRDRIAVQPGCLNYYFTPDWRAVPMHDSFGHDVETAFLLVEAAEALGRDDDEPTWRMARAIVDHALQWGWDAELGGFFEGGEAFRAVHDRHKTWWTQAEGLNALLLMHERFGGETDRYRRAFVEQLRFIWDHQIDHAHGGWYGEFDPAGKLTSPDKASPWKAAYHNSRALINVVKRLRHLAGRTGRDAKAE